MQAPAFNITSNSTTMTSSDIAVANIVYQQDGPAKVHLERLHTSTQLTGYAKVSGKNIIPLSKGSIHADAGIEKTYRKGLKATLRVQQFLNSTSAFNNMEKVMPSTMNVGATSIVGGPPTGCYARDVLHIGPASFEEVDFEFLSTDDTQPTSSAIASSWNSQVPRSMTSTQYLQFACPTLKVEDAIVDSNGHSRYESISITSGTCLFSSNILKACNLSSGSLSSTPLSYAKPTFYEIEFIARAAPAIADLASTVLSRNKALGLSTPLSINLDIPTWHYYKAIDSKLAQGFCTAHDALLFIQAIEKRHDQVSAVFEEAIRYACAIRGQNPVIIHSSRFSSVSACIKSALAAGFRPSFEDVMQELHQEKGGIWRQFLQLIPDKDYPEDFQSLGLLFYVYQVMKTAFLPRGPDQAIEYDFEPSLQISAPEEMSICLPSMSASTRLSSQEMDDFYLDATTVAPVWSQCHASALIGESTDEDDNELSFDASSTVDIRVLSSEAWASSADSDSDSGNDTQLECVTVVQDASYRTIESGTEMVFCRSPRLIGQDVVDSAANALYLSPTSDSFESAVCMAGAQNGAGSTALAEAGDEHSNDAMLSTFKAANSFCNQAGTACSEPSSDDELASHGFMLPGPVLSRSPWAPSWAGIPTDEALPILTDDETSHTAMQAAHSGFVVYHFNMDKGITEKDWKALDDEVSFAAMVSYRRARTIKQHASEDVHRGEPASKDECLSCAAMLPTSTVASNIIMSDAGWDMNDSGDESAAHAAMTQCLVMMGADESQPVGIDEMDSCVAMMPTSEVASTAVMVLATSKYSFRNEDDEHTSHASMLATFTEPESLKMAKHMCMTAAVTPINVPGNLNNSEAPMDEFAAHAAMMGTVDLRKEHEGHQIEEAKQESDDAVVSHFAMLSVDHAASSSGMIGSLGLGDGSAAELSTTMPMDDHASHSAMARIADHESSAYMLSTLSPDDRDVVAEMKAADFDVELASHAAMRGIVDLSSSFCMAETLTAVLKIKEDTAVHVLMEAADTNVVILCSGEDEDESNITMLYPAAEEDYSHAAMVSLAAARLTNMNSNEQVSHVAMLPDSIAPFFVGKPTRLATILEDTTESLASHAVMLPTSNDDFASHGAMLPTSTDDFASHEVMRPTSNDEVVSHGAMLPTSTDDSASHEVMHPTSNDEVVWHAAIMPATGDDELREMSLQPEDFDSHSAMLTSSICMAATLSEERITATRASSTRSSTSSAGFVKLPKNKVASPAHQLEKPRVLILSVDDRCEKRIYTQAQKLLRKLRASPDADTTPTLVEAYLMNRVFANGNADGGILYFEDMSSDLPIGENRLEMEPVELVKKLYGEKSASNLDKWFKDVGLGL